uniref:HEPN domain-containing protein n=1 Tax=Cyprinus carpio TaxID=7962 RepID=A0A8C2J569_CYPCA
ESDIFKELLQNAEDAGATTCKFLLDFRKHRDPPETLFDDGMALSFTEEDWEGIQRVGRSIKQDDPTKVGRFGIGFNSVYHITDLPCVFSSEHLAIFDPQKKMFGEDEEGYRWSLNDEEDRESLLKFRDQFQPFQNTVSKVNSCSWEKVISEEQYFKGTLFRFPLRNEASEISDNLYDSTKVTQLFDSFIADADISLLFLRNVSSITLLHIDTNGLCNNRLKVSVSNHFITGLYHIKQESFDRKMCFKTISHISQQMEETRSKWLVTTCLLKQGYIPEIDSLAKKLSFYPQVDAAFRLDGDRSLCNGRLSCFLPLPNNEPNKTGLPIHINACFGLTDNRRFIKWQEEDQKNDESAMWNELLTKDILPHVYLMMILDAIQLSGVSALPSPTVYNLWPDLSKTVHKERWHEVATNTLKVLFEYKIFHLADNEQIWVSPSDAVFPVKNICSNTMSAVSRLLIAKGENLVTVPEHVLKDVQEIFPKSDTLTWVTPSYARAVLHRSEAENLSKDDKYSLLEFALSDEKYTELEGLKLLPLSDGTFTSFGNGVQKTVLIDNEKFPRTLLPFCKERFLPNDLSHFCTVQLKKLATRSIYNIINLDAQQVVALTKQHLPMDWKVSQGHVTWKTTEDHHPPKSWLAEFWKFLSAEWNELSSFINMPLIPVEPLQSSGNSILLARLQSNTTLIFQSSTGSNLSNNVQKVLKTVGCTVIKRDECLRHRYIESYVLPASPRNVLQVIVNSNRDQVIKGIASASSHEREELKVYLSSLDSLTVAEQNLLSMLPIFKMMSGKYVAVKSKQAVVSTTNPAIPNDLPMPDTIVQCANEADRRLLTLLNIELLDAAKVAVHLVDCIKTGSFKNSEEQTIMTWILKNGSILLSQSEQLVTKTKSLNFIETTQGERKQASNVFDPRNKTFQDLFEGDFFPPPIYTKTQEMLQSLQRLGLKTDQKELSTANILQVINHIEKLCVHSPDKAFKKAHTLVGVLNSNDFLSKFTKIQIGELMQRKWVPCENPEFLNGSICRNLKRCLYKPAEVRDSKYSSIVGYVMPITSELNRHVCNSLGLYEPPPAEKVWENLSALRSMVNPNSDFQFKTKLHSIYKFMQDNMGNFRDLMDTKCIPWIWNKSEFVCPGDIVLAYPPGLDLSPYIKKVPEEFLQYENLLTKFGVKKTLSDEEIENILHDIKHTIDRRCPPHGDSTELEVSIAILDWIRKNEKLLKDSTPVPVMAQDQKFTLQSLSKTVFCDISAEALDDLKQDNEEFYVIHEEVKPLTARWLKVPFLSTRILKPQFIQAEQEFFGIEQCGQSEPITQRIKNILKEYDEESDIFKELLQNAEDAEATTCKFLLDFRKHRDPPETLIDDGMAFCNGPCLWIFNNELFSEEDWRNIVKVGSASKENKVEMIEKFGLGFNSVYHVSDIPSILSGNTLLILDPNVTHLEKHILSKGNPGIKLNPFQERLYKRFPGQFKSHEGIFDCDLSAQNSKKAYNGTLIKLPFRTLEEANKSEISSKVYDEERIWSFKNNLTDNSETHLLFLKKIKTYDLLPLEDIIERAGKISSVWKQDESKFRKCLQCLMQSMKESSENVNSLHWLTLSQIPFLPALAPLDHQNKINTVLKKPSDVYMDSCLRHSYDSVLQKLKVQTNPPVETVLQQLLKAHQHCNAFEKTALLNIAQSCYEYLNNYLLEQKDPNPIIGHAKSFPFIFIEDHFVNVKAVARSEEFEKKPYLYVLPVIFSKFERLWDCIGVQKQFTKEQFVAALEEIKALYGSQPLTTSDLHNCVAILVNGLYEIKEKLTNCLIPDERGVLISSEELRYNDSPWMPVSGVKLSHELIPRTVACRFGVMTTRHHTLKEHFVSGFSLYAKEFGQTEKLTVRIKNIIDAYPSKKDILKELIQNADDAEATEIHFVWDKRKHKTEKIFGEKWKLAQGPALCVYNNRTFSDADLQGIQQLGEGGKHGSLGRTGKYGLGFNSVYHLTDCPSILTGDKWLCISDPNLKYVEGVTKQSPGCKFSMEDEFKKSFEDVYHTFLPEMFALHSGTMFRLPLRTEKMAEKSEISRRTVTDRDMKDFYNALTDDPEGLILFLKHITKIQLSEISEDGKQLKCSFLIEKKYTEKSMVSKENFHRHVQDSFMSRTAEPSKTIYGIQISSGINQSQWVIAECFGFSEQNFEQKNKQDYFKVPQAALAACLSSSFNYKFTGRAFCSLPLPGETGLPVHVNANFEVDSSRRDLWKEDGDSVKTEWNQFLKKNIISPLYADLLLHLCSDMKKHTPTALVFLKSELEKSCLKYFPCISPEVNKVWHEMIHEVYRSINQRDLPVIPTAHAAPVESSHRLQDKKIHKYTVTWCSVSEPHSENCPYFTTDDHNGIFEILDDSGMKLVPYSWKMHEINCNFKLAGVNVAEISPSTVMNFLKQRSLNDPSQTTSGLPLPINQTCIKDKTRCSKLLSFCLENVKEKNVQDLNGLPLLLTEDQMLRVFESESPKLISRFSSLFRGHQEMFADMVVNMDHFQILHDGKFIKGITIDIAATYLKPEIQLLLRQSLPDQRCQLYKADAETIKWLKTLWTFFDYQEKSYQNEKLNVFSEIKKHFDDSPILPVICPSQNNTHFLETMNDISKVIHYEKEKIVSILIKLGFMKIDLVFFKDLSREFRHNMNQELLQTGDSSAVLGQVHHVSHSQFEELSKEECIDLQRFLQHGIRDSNNKSQYVSMLKSLPLFESISGKRERIDLHRMVYILNSKHQDYFPNLYHVDGCDSIFLKYTVVNLELAECLKIKILDDLEFCVQFILPTVHMMKEGKLLDFMRLLVELGPVDKRIVSALKDVRVIRDIQGSLQVASYFYDDSVHLYKEMLPKERFVPKTFWEIFQDKHFELCDYHKAFAQDREVVAISGSLIGRDSDHQYLIWTSMPILPLENCSPHHMKKIKDAGALETPPPGEVAANLKNICRSPCQKDRLLETRKNVFSKSYAYLQSTDFDASLFLDLPIILVENETTLVKAKQTALVLHDAFEFRPYLYKIPSKYMKFEDFFKKIGVEEEPTIDQYSTVLQEIYSDSSDKDSLQANQQKTVKRVVQQLFGLLKKKQNKTLFFPNNQLYLPSTDGKIYDSRTLFFNDTFFQAERLEGPLETKLKLLEKFNCCHLGNDHYEHQTLLQFLPEHVRPKFLSDVISENLEETSVQYCDYEGCEFSGWFDKHLSSAAFLHGLVCLIREESKGSVSQSEAAEKCEEIFSKIQIICCKTLQTELLLNLEPLEGSRAETDVYVKKQQNGCSFYLKHNDDMAHKVVNEINMCLTKEINALLKNCLTTLSLLVLGQLLLCDNMEDVEKTLAKYGIHSSGQKEEGHGALPKPGCHIPEEWHDCLDMNFLNNFESGEYVGFSKDDSGEYFYAIVIEQVDDPLGQARQFPGRYKIQVGSDDFIDVSSLDLYQFKRETKATVSKGSTCTDIEFLLTSKPPPKTVFPETLEEIKREIDQSLNEIWKMSSEDKQKALKRLYLRWHPDKNPRNEVLATEAFKYLQNRIEELQQGKTTQSTSSNWRDFRGFYDTWNTEARSHRRGRERFYQNYSRRHYNFWSYHREAPRPNREEAKRWYEQAQCDIRAAHNDTGGESSEWCLFKVHQAVEKALIAAMYRGSGHQPNNCSITSLAQQVSHFSSQLASLPSTVRQLTELGVDGKKTQYPNYHQFPHIPNKQFGVNNARSALDIATKLLEKIEEYIS